MATIIEAFEAAKAGKAVSHNGHPIIVRYNTLAWEDSVDAVVFVTSNTLNGWTIEEPSPPEPEYVDYKVDLTDNGPVWIVGCFRKFLDLVWREKGFSGYGYTHSDGSQTISNYPFCFNMTDTDQTQTYNRLSAKEVSGIVWCDFVRFEKSKS